MIMEIDEELASCEIEDWNSFNCDDLEFLRREIHKPGELIPDNVDSLNYRVGNNNSMLLLKSILRHVIKQNSGRMPSNEQHQEFANEFIRHGRFDLFLLFCHGVRHKFPEDIGTEIFIGKQRVGSIIKNGKGDMYTVPIGRYIGHPLRKINNAVWSLRKKMAKISLGSVWQELYASGHESTFLTKYLISVWHAGQWQYDLVRPETISHIDNKFLKTKKAITRPRFSVPQDFVYIIRNGSFGPYKIGRSRKPENRLRELQTANPGELSICKIVRDANAANLEKMVHDHVRHLHIKNEWFELYEKDLTDLVLEFGFTTQLRLQLEDKDDCVEGLFGDRLYRFSPSNLPALPSLSNAIAAAEWEAECLSEKPQPYDGNPTEFNFNPSL